MTMMKNVIPLFVFFMLLSQISYADEPKITSITKGQLAPWSGVLFSNEAAAQVAATYSTIPDKIEVERKNERQLCDAKCKKTVSDILATHDRKISVLSAETARLNAENKQISDLLKKEEKKKSNTVLLTSVGFITGIILTIITVYAVNKVTK